jgi:hypothetical protein
MIYIVVVSFRDIPELFKDALLEILEDSKVSKVSSLADFKQANMKLGYAIFLAI